MYLQHLAQGLATILVRKKKKLLVRGGKKICGLSTPAREALYDSCKICSFPLE
jgi:hypothetical protein